VRPLFLWVLTLDGQTPRVDAPLSLWIGFNVVILALLAIDLGFLRRGRTPSLRRLILTTVVWVAAAVAFGAWIGWTAGNDKGLQFFTGYVIEYTLSMDNILLFVMIFSSFGITPQHQGLVLFWGVLGALVMRGLMIVAGVALIERFDWIFYVFGAYIVYAGVNLFLPQKHAADVGEQLIVRLARRVLPLSAQTQPSRFVVRENGQLRFTLLFLVLIVIELTDLVFALDSIPAIFGVTTDPFIVYTSNACAILGLRSLYFLLARAVKSLIYLQAGLGVVLIFIGAKMLLKSFVPISTGQSLVVVGGILAVAIVASLVVARTKGTHAHP